MNTGGEKENFSVTGGNSRGIIVVERSHSDFLTGKGGEQRGVEVKRGGLREGALFLSAAQRPARLLKEERQDGSFPERVYQLDPELRAKRSVRSAVFVFFAQAKKCLKVFYCFLIITTMSITAEIITEMESFNLILGEFENFIRIFRQPEFP